MRNFLYCFSLSVGLLTSAVGANDLASGPDMPQWEARVSPPPAGEWLQHMPRSGQIRFLAGHSVRIAYVIPSNRTAQANAVEKLRYAVQEWQSFYLDHMERNGFGSRTFSLETESDNITPKVHIVNAPSTDDYYRVDPWTRVNQAAQNAGLPVWSNGNVWLIVYEAHVMNSDGSITGAWNGGANSGSGSAGGVGMTCAYMLTLVTSDYLTDNRNYHNLILPEVGTYPMQYGVTQASFDGSTVSSLSSVQHGVIWHETDHALGMSHDFRNDNNFAGNLMGNGFRGTRGYQERSLYPNDEVRGSYSSCLALSVSRYFNPDGIWTDSTPPGASLITAGLVTPVDGLLPIRFVASDASGLASALLLRGGDVIGEISLSGTSVDETISTPYYTPGTSASYAVHVYDQQGNRQVVSASIVAATGFNRAPQPFFHAKPSRVIAGQPILLDATQSFDYDHGSALVTIEWDLNNDGIYDTSPTSTKTYTATFNTPGIRQIRCRLTDLAGASSVSTPIGLRIDPIPVTAASADWMLVDQD